MIVAKLADDGRQPELVDARHLGRNRAKSRTDAGFLAEDIDPEAAALGGDIGEIEVVAVAQCFSCDWVSTSVM